VKIIGIIGGMGPLATLDLVEKIIKSTPAKMDQEHLRILVDIDPGIPDRTRALQTGERQAVANRLLLRAQGLTEQGAKLLAMACNTAHAFLPDFSHHLKVPMVDMIHTTIGSVQRMGVKRVGLLATLGTLESGIWTHPLNQAGIEVILPDLPGQKQVMAAIYALKSGEEARARTLAYRAYNSLETGQVVAACTELPILLEGKPGLVDPSLVLARELVRLAAG